MIPIKLVNARIEGNLIKFTCNKIEFEVNSKHCIKVKK